MDRNEGTGEASSRLHEISAGARQGAEDPLTGWLLHMLESWHWLLVESLGAWFLSPRASLPSDWPFSTSVLAGSQETRSGSYQFLKAWAPH